MAHDDTPEPADAPSARPDAWGEAVAAFLADLLDNVEVAVLTDGDPEPACGSDGRIPVAPVRGSDGRTRQFRLHRLTNAPGAYADLGSFPDELADLPDAALRALARVTRSTAASDLVYPSVARALHDVVIAEVLADRLVRRIGDSGRLDQVALLVANTLDYFEELAATRHEGGPVCHGVVIVADACGLVPIAPAVLYPGRLPTRKRTPLLFDGTQAVLVVSPSGQVLGGVGRESLPATPASTVRVHVFDEFPGIDGALTAAAAAVFHGVGAYLGPDHSIWIFDEGEPVFIRRTTRWKSIAIESFAGALAELGEMSSVAAAGRIVRATLRMSIEGHGALLAVASGPAALVGLVQPKDRYPARGVESGLGSVDDELHRLVPEGETPTSGLLARLARIDGATIVDTSGALLAYGAVVRSTDSRGEGARTAAARALSMQLNVAVAVSQDGPITVFHRGEVVLSVL